MSSAYSLAATRSHGPVHLVAVLVVVATLLPAGRVVYDETREFTTSSLPVVPEVTLASVLLRSAPLTVTIGGHGVSAVWRTTATEVRTSTALWRRMHLADWNGVPVGLRREGLDAMLVRYRDVLMRPPTWDRMTREDWDLVPQPIRTVAYRQMVAYWSGFYALGAPYDIAPHLVAETLAAIVMTESWFDHRAGRVYSDGSRDIGLAQASDFARQRLRQLYGDGRVDIAPVDEDYLNPWVATRFVAVWMTLMLDEAAGDLDLAVRAYNRGIRRANDARGSAYFEMVQRRLARYIRNIDAPPAWDYVWRRAREIERQEWPWVRKHPGHRRTYAASDDAKR